MSLAARSSSARLGVAIELGQDKAQQIIADLGRCFGRISGLRLGREGFVLSRDHALALHPANAGVLEQTGISSALIARLSSKQVAQVHARGSQPVGVMLQRPRTSRTRGD